MTDEKKDESEITLNEAVKAMGDGVKSDVPMGLATVPKGASPHAIARRTAGQLILNELEFHCLACGWNKSLKFDEDELKAMEAAGSSIREYTGPCPGCQCMTLAPKDSFWGSDFPSMSSSAMKQKREEAQVQAEELVNAVEKKVADIMGGAIPKPETTDEVPAPEAAAEDLPDAPDLSKLKPR